VTVAMAGRAPASLLAVLLAGVAGAGAAGVAHAQDPAGEQVERVHRAYRAEPPAAAREQRLHERIEDSRGKIEGPSEPAAGAVDADVAERLAEALGVEVLEVRAIGTAQGPAYAAKVMNPGGNANAAFRVRTLVVDRESGEVLGELRSGIATAAGFPGGGPQFSTGGEERGFDMRRRSVR